MSAASKRRWRTDPRNRAAENDAHTDRRNKPGARLEESIRDTLRHAEHRSLARAIERMEDLT